MGVSIPSSYDHDVDINSISPITVSNVGPVGPVTVSGIPDTYHINIDHIPKIELKIDPVEIKPIDLSLRLKEIPSIRGHLPTDYCIGLSLLGVELIKVRLCGETQVITEPYRPNPCELCGAPAITRTWDRTQLVGTVLTIKED